MSPIQPIFSASTHIEKLKQEYSNCQKCPALCQSRTQVVFGSGNPLAEVLFIGEAPGASEDRQGIPFCGMSGKILNDLLAAISFPREEIFITNTILCRPENNRNPTKEEVENCRKRLDKLISIMKPKIIVTIGNFATERILGKKGVTGLHGKVFSLTMTCVETPVTVIPIIHPANYLYNGRNPQLFEEMKTDFKMIAQVIEAKKRQKALNEF